MSQEQTKTQTMKISDVKQQFNSLVNQIYRGQTRVVVEKSGIPVAAIVSPDDLQRLDQLEQERDRRFRILEEFGAAFADVPVAELEREVNRALSGVRAARRAEGEQSVGAKA